MIEEREFYVCPNHQATGGYESCCSCGGWYEGEEQRLCSEADELSAKQKGDEK